MIAIDETGNKVLLGRGVSAAALKEISALAEPHIYSVNIPESSIQHLQDSSSQANRLKTPLQERCGRKLASTSGMFDITLGNLGYRSSYSC